MSRIYGNQQRAAVRDIREGLIDEIEMVYLKAFDKLKDSGLGDGLIVRLTQLLLLSKDGAISSLKKEIEGSDISKSH